MTEILATTGSGNGFVPILHQTILPDSMLTDYPLDPQQKIQWNVNQNFLSRKHI